MHQLWLIPIFPLVGFAINGLFGRRSKAVVNAAAIGTVALSFLWVLKTLAALGMFGGSMPEEPYIERYYTWIASGNFNIGFDFAVDHLSAVMLLVVTGVGLLIHIYAAGYMAHESGYYRFFAYLNLFMFFMLVLVLGANYLVLFIGWEGVGLCSYLLIGFYNLEKFATDAGKKAFIVNRIGDFGYSLGIFLVAVNFGSLDFGKVFESAKNMPVDTGAGLFTGICLLLFVGATGKSAQIPLFVWLPDAMAGPTPVSALIHAATMVTAGVYMVSRSAPLFIHSPHRDERCGDYRTRDRCDGGDDRSRAERYQKGICLLDGFAARLHVSGIRFGRVRGRNVPCRDTCVLQSAAVPWRRQRNSCSGRRTGSTKDGRPSIQDADHVLSHCFALPSLSRVCRLFPDSSARTQF